MGFIIFIIFIMIAVTIVTLTGIVLTWILDILNVSDDTIRGYSNYKGFKEQFEKVEWERHGSYLTNKGSDYFLSNCTDKIDKYGTYPTFNKKLMIMSDPINNVLMKSFVKRKFKEIELQRTKDSHKKGEGEWR